MKVGKYFMSLMIQHAKSKQQFATMHVRGFVIDQVSILERNESFCNL